MPEIRTASDRLTVEPDVEVDAYTAWPVGQQALATLVVLPEIWGTNENIRAVCDRLAAAGYAAVSPDLYRGARGPTEAATGAEIAASFEHFPDERGIRDCRAYARWAAAWELGGRSTFVWGFCMGGRFAHYAGVFCPELAGVINFYGRQVFPRYPSKPFLPMDVAGLMRVPYLGQFAEHDPIIPLADVAQLRAKVAESGAPHRIDILAGAHHAFFNERRASYDASAAARAWDTVIDFVEQWRVR